MAKNNEIIEEVVLEEELGLSEVEITEEELEFLMAETEEEVQDEE